MEYDEQAAINYIRARFDADASQRIDDDEILNVIDIIWDYYDEHGLLDIDVDDSDDDVVEVDQLLAYVKKMIAKDKKSPLTPADVETIVNAEIEYEDSLDEI